MAPPPKGKALPPFRGGRARGSTLIGCRFPGGRPVTPLAAGPVAAGTGGRRHGPQRPALAGARQRPVTAGIRQRLLGRWNRRPARRAGAGTPVPGGSTPLRAVRRAAPGCTSAASRPRAACSRRRPLSGGGMPLLSRSSPVTAGADSAAPAPGLPVSGWLGDIISAPAAGGQRSGAARGRASARPARRPLDAPSVAGRPPRSPRLRRHQRPPRPRRPGAVPFPVACPLALARRTPGTCTPGR